MRQVVHLQASASMFYQFYCLRRVSTFGESSHWEIKNHTKKYNVNTINMQHNKYFQLSGDGSSKCRNMMQAIKTDKKLGCE